MTTKRSGTVSFETYQQYKVFCVFTSIVFVASFLFLAIPALSYAGEPSEKQMSAALLDFDDVFVRQNNLDWGRRGAVKVSLIYFKKNSCAAIIPGREFECTFVFAQKLVGPMANGPSSEAINRQMMVRRDGIAKFVFLGGDRWKFISTDNE